MQKAAGFNLQRQFLAIVGTLPLFAWMSGSALYPMAQKYRSSSILEEREGYSLVANSPHLAAEIAMQASSHAEALLRGKEQLNGYVQGGNSRLKEVETIMPITVKKLGAKEAQEQDPLILLGDRFNNSPDQGLYLIGYCLGLQYSRSFLGKPNNPYVKLREKDRELVAVRHFWGYPTPNKVSKEETAFKKLLERDGYAYDNMYIAEYSPPWAFYFIRRNELVVPLKRQQQEGSTL